MKCDELNDDDMDIDLDTEEEFISIKPSGDSFKDLGDISVQQQQRRRCYTPQQSQVKEKNEKGTEEEFIQIEPSGDSSKDLDNISDQQQQCVKSQIKENIQKGIYTVHYDSKGKGNVWNILRKIRNQDNLYVEGYAWCTQCCYVVSDKSPTSKLHECCKKFRFSQIAENIKNGIYTLTKYNRLRYLSKILRKIVDENNSPIDGCFWCIKCHTVLLDYTSNRANHKCSKDLKRKLAKDSVKQYDGIAKHLEIANQIENGTYTLSGRYTTKTMRRILKADKTLVEGYVFCNQCRKVYSDYASQKNIHPCYRELKSALTKDITDDDNNIKSRRFEIAEKLEKGIYTLAKHQSTSFVWTFMRKILKEDKTPIEDFTCCIKCGDVISSRTMTNIKKHNCCNELMKSIHEDSEDEDEDHADYHTKAELRVQIAQKIQQGSYTLIERNSRAYIWKIIRNIQREDDKTILKGYVFCIECENVHRYATTDNIYTHKCCKILKESLLKNESVEGIAKKIAQGIYTVTSMKSSSYLRNLMMVIVKEDKTSCKDYLFCSKCRKVYSIVRAVHLRQHKCYGEFKSSILKQKEVNDDNDADNDENISELGYTMTVAQVIELESDKNASDQDDLGQDSAINTKDEENNVISDDDDDENTARQDSACDKDWRIADQDFPSSKGAIYDKSFTNSEQDKENLLWDNIKLEEPEFCYTVTGEIVIEIESDENSSNQDDIGQDSAINTKVKGNTVISDDDDDENISRQDSACDKDWIIADQDSTSSKGVINDKSFTNSEHDKENLIWDNIKLEEPEFGYTVTGDVVIELESDENSSNQDDLGQDSAIKTKDKGNTVSVEDDNDNRSRQDSACDEDWRIADQDFSSSKGVINDKSFTNSKQDEDKDLPKSNIRRFEVAEKLDKGIYTLAKHQSRSYVWIFMRKILKEDGTETGYARCIKCGTVRANTDGNLYSHRCCKLFRESLLKKKKSDSLKKSKEDEIAQKIAQGIDTVTSMKSGGYLSKFIKAIVKEDKTIYKNYVFCSKCRQVYSVVRVYQHKCYGEFKSSILKQNDVSDDNDGDDADNDENISRQDAACDKDLRTADQDFSSSKGVINDKSFTTSEQDEDLPWDIIKIEDTEFGCTMTGEQVIELESDENSSNQDDEDSNDKDDDCQFLEKTINRMESRPSTSREAAQISDFTKETKNRKESRPSSSREAAKISDFTKETKNRKESRPSTSREAAQISDFTKETKNRKESRSPTSKDAAKLCDFLEETKTCQESRPSATKDDAKLCDFLEETKNRKDPCLAKSKDAAKICYFTEETKNHKESRPSTSRDAVKICDFTEKTKNHKESRPSTSRDAVKICDFTEETKNRRASRPFVSKDSAKKFEFLEETKKLITTNSDRLNSKSLQENSNSKRKIPQDEDELETVQSHETNMNNMKVEMIKPTNFSKKFKHGQSFNPDKKISSSIDSIDPKKFLHSQASTSSLDPQLNSRETIQILNEVYTISRKKAKPKSHMECLSSNP
ncbi:uncharacterized protein LOC142222320 [Haematobia irritans]|uniref:uncharacterized protein LOC142222320 n=1 Tax=Haematobia irritans TaxID=7368 RepID=UPI003F502C48